MTFVRQHRDPGHFIGRPAHVRIRVSPDVFSQAEAAIDAQATAERTAAALERLSQLSARRTGETR